MDIVLTREETMETLRKCLNHVECPCMTEGCYLAGHHDCMVQLYENVVALLEEQDAVKPVRDEKTGRLWLCGKCGSYVGFEDNDPHDPNEFDKYCRKCGRPVLWEGR